MTSATPQRGEPLWAGEVLDPSATLLDVDTAVRADPAASGGSAAATTFSTNAEMARRWQRTVTLEGERRGPCELWVAVRAEPGVEVEIQARWGARESARTMEASVDVPSGDTGGEYRVVRWGRISSDTGILEIEGWAARRGGTGQLYWDRLWIAEVGSGFVPPLPLVGGGPPAAGAPPTMPHAAAGAPALPGAAVAPALPSARRKKLIRRGAAIAAVLAAGVGAALALGVGRSDPVIDPTVAASASPSPSPEPPSTTAAGFSGAYRVETTVEDLSGRVRGLKVGDSETSSWILRSRCESGPCETELVGMNLFGAAIKATGDLEGGVFSGTTKNELVCTNNDTGEVLFSYSGPGTFEITVTEAEIVGGVPRVTAFEGSFRYRYQAKGRSPGCSPRIVERDSVTGTLLRAGS